MFANWLNTAFAGLDGGMFNFVHNVANKCGGFLTPILKFVTMLGNDGWAFIVLGIILLLFRKKQGRNRIRRRGLVPVFCLYFAVLSRRERCFSSMCRSYMISVAKASLVTTSFFLG